MFVFFAIVSFILNLLLIPTLILAIKRLSSWHDFFTHLEGFLFKGINFFDKLLTTPTFTNVPEVIQANNNMKIIRNQLEQFAKAQGGKVVELLDDKPLNEV